MITKTELKDFLIKNSIYLREEYFKKKFPEIYKELNEIKFPDYYIFMRKLYHYINDDFELKLSYCEICGCEKRFKTFASGYYICPKKCKNKKTYDEVYIENKQKLLKLLTTPSKNGGIGIIHESGFCKKFPEIYKEICSIKFPENFQFRQKLYHYVYDDYELNLGTCKYCGKRTTFKNLPDGYCEYCSKTCCQKHFVYLDKIGKRKRVCGFAINNNREKAKQTMLERHGVENPQQLKSVQKKTLKTKRKKYGKNLEKITEKTKHTKFILHGDENYNNHEKYVQTCLEKHNVTNIFAAEETKEKIKETCLRKHGVTHPMKSKKISKKMANTKINNSEENKAEIRRKLRETWDNKSPEEIEEIVNRGKKTKLEIYGDENYSNRDLFVETCNERYDGVGFGSKTTKEKIENTLERVYGVRHNMQIPSCVENAKLSTDQTRHMEEFIQRMRDRYNRVYDEYIKYGLNPKGGISETELLIYKFLIEFFKNDVIAQYCSEEYPFRCDFYIKSLDLYIELNAHWTHGGHPFDETNTDDIEILNKWKSNNTKYYDKAVEVWSVVDVIKRNTAKKNNLNYLEIFSDNIEEIKKIILDYISNL